MTFWLCLYFILYYVIFLSRADNCISALSTFSFIFCIGFNRGYYYHGRCKARGANGTDQIEYTKYCIVTVHFHYEIYYIEKEKELLIYIFFSYIFFVLAVSSGTKDQEEEASPPEPFEYPLDDST